MSKRLINIELSNQEAKWIVYISDKNTNDIPISLLNLVIKIKRELNRQQQEQDDE